MHLKLFSESHFVQFIWLNSLSIVDVKVWFVELEVVTLCYVCTKVFELFWEVSLSYGTHFWAS